MGWETRGLRRRLRTVASPLRWWTARPRLRALTLAAGRRVWRCPVEAPAYRALRSAASVWRGRTVELEGCWYDFDAEGAVLYGAAEADIGVAALRRAGCGARRGRARQRRGFADDADVCALSPARRCGRPRSFAASGEAGSTGVTCRPARATCLALPRQVEGRRSCASGVRARRSSRRPRLVYPKPCAIIERDNACRGTKRLILPRRLSFHRARTASVRVAEGPGLSRRACARSGRGSSSTRCAACRTWGRSCT